MTILGCSDLHLSDNKPICRADADWVATQQKHLNVLLEASIKLNVDAVVLAGDIFDKPVVHPRITNMVINFMQEINKQRPIYIIQGNHDAYMHNAKLVQECSFGAIREIRGRQGGTFDYGTIPDACNDSYPFVVVHTFTVPTSADKPPVREAMTAADLCNIFTHTPIIIVGDNHEHWCKKIGNQLVVNCGTLIQRTAAEAKRPCGYYVIDTDTLEAEYIALQKMSEGCIDLTYLENIKERDANKQNYEALIAALKDGIENKYDFVSTLAEYLETNKNVIANGVYNILQDTLTYVRRT